MNAEMPRRIVTGCVIRPGQSVPDERAWEDAPPEERIAAVSDLTLLCLAWNGDPPANRDLRDLLAEFNAHGANDAMAVRSDRSDTT
jgi:hypothetical protein